MLKGYFFYELYTLLVNIMFCVIVMTDTTDATKVHKCTIDNSYTHKHVVIHPQLDSNPLT